MSPAAKGNATMRYMLGIDVGGTFTDFVAYDRDTRQVNVWKSLSAPKESGRRHYGRTTTI